MAKVNQQAITDSIIYSRNKLNRTAENWKSIEWEPTEEQEEAEQISKEEIALIKSEIAEEFGEE